MRTMGKKISVVILLLSPLVTTSVLADEGALNQRIDRLERIIQGQGLVSLLGRVDQLQNEVQRLNGDNESLRHEIEIMQKRQRDLYLDLDQRLQAQSQLTQNHVTTAVEGENSLKTLEKTFNQPEDKTVTSPTSAEQAKNTIRTSPVAVENGEADYQAALQILRSGQYEQAIKSLSAFPEKYPQSSYLPNSYYWRGEANYVLRHFDLAVVAFQTVIDRFPASSKVADATLKLGFSQYELGKIEMASTTLQSVIDSYPNTSAARLAKVRLDRIKQANN